MIHDPYVISEATIKEPPTTLLRRFKFLGPGFILSASIVGSGELIATTILGAKAGFVALWIIIISCLAKVAVQLEFGKHAVLTGERCMQAFSKVSGPRRWAVWTLFILIALKVIQLGGMLGGTVVILNMLFPGIPITAWAIITAFSVGLLIFNGRYGIIEKLSLVMIAAFTLLTLASLFSLQFTSFGFSWLSVLEQQQFSLPPGILPYAIGAFGITGVASDEIIAYNYWCLEKGYAKYTGPRSDTPDWRRRAKGWIQVMFLDATVAMIIYTVVTVAFYLLGAAVLHERGEVPHGNEVIETLALIYTQSLGPGIKTAYLVGGFFVLFSSLFATLGAWTRIFPDIFGELGWLEFNDLKKRKRVITWLAWIFPGLWTIAYLFIELPVLMVLFGGLIGSFMLFIVIIGAIHFKYGRTQLLPSGQGYTIAFWISIISVFIVGIYGIVEAIKIT
ncbi:MAG TPA: Nramp family divalent metal transporter [Cyclobacteriaceae bacterium]|nr:Nramp family divalent metal transporter [Cyclobacteriaceae bacterium]